MPRSALARTGFVAGALFTSACSLLAPSDAELTAGLDAAGMDAGKDGGRDGARPEAGRDEGPPDGRPEAGDGATDAAADGSDREACVEVNDPCSSSTSACCTGTVCEGNKCVPCADKGESCKLVPCCTGRCKPGHKTCK